MGERIAVTLEFGGTITAAQADRLLELIAHEQFYLNDQDMGVREELIRDDLKHKLRADEVNYGQIDGLDDYLKQERIVCRWWIEECSGESQDIRWYDGSGNCQVYPAYNQEPCFLASDLLKIEELASGLGNILRQARELTQELKLEIIP